MDLSSFADEVGSAGPVTCVGGRTQWDVGGAVHAEARDVRAPAGVELVEPEEMVVRCGAGTPVTELQAALADVGQMVALPEWPGATVGGVLAVGRSGILRLGRGPVRDTLLQAGVVTAAGTVVKAGGPTVKNVSGFDLCRLLVGSIGTLAFIGDVILRTRPRPAVQQWLAGEADPFAIRRDLYRPASILWDGVTTWVCLEGHPADVLAQSSLVPELREVPGPPDLPSGGRRSLAPGELPQLSGTFVAEVGIGVVHVAERPEPRVLEPAVAELHHRLKRGFDPEGRLNPGRCW